MPTRYTLDVDLKDIVSVDALQFRDKKVTAAREAKARFEDRFKSGKNRWVYFGFFEHQQLKRETNKPILMVKFLKPNKAVVLLQGRFASHKAVIVLNFDDGNRDIPYNHCLVAGLAKYPKKVIRKDSAKKTAKKFRVKTFLKVASYSHIMPTHYTLDVDLKDIVSIDALQSRDKKVTAAKETKARFKDRFQFGRNRWFFSKLRWVHFGFSEHQQLKRETNKPISMVKFLKPNKTVVLLQSRFAGQKGMIVLNFDDGNQDRPYNHCLVAGLAKYPKMEICKDSAKKISKKSRVKAFLKVVNYSHIMPTRYTLNVNLKDIVSVDALQSRDKNVIAAKETKARFEDRFKSGKNRLVYFGFFEHQQLKRETNKPISTVKLLKPNKEVVLLQGRFACHKAVIVLNFDDGNRDRPYSHCLVAGLANYPKKVIRKDSDKKTTKKSRIKAFLKAANYSHIMPIRYTLDVDLKDIVSVDAVQSRVKKVTVAKETMARFEDRFQSGKSRWFFSKLRF